MKTNLEKVKEVGEEVYPNGGRAKIKGWYRFSGPAGEVVEGEESFVKTYAEICQKDQEDTERWIAWLRTFGVKMAHPNDGWNDRRNKTFTPCYPRFDDGVEVDDLIALGTHEGFVVVKIKKIVKSLFSIKKFEYVDYK